MKRKSFIFSLLGCLTLLLISFTSCKKEIDYSLYLSENRRDVFIAEGDEYRLKIYAVEKEYPYSADGFVGEKSERVEVYFTIKNGGDDYHLTLLADGIHIQGDMSYDGVQGEYYFSSAAHLGDAKVLDVKIEGEKRNFAFQATSVKNSDTLSSHQILNALIDDKKDLFASMSVDGEFEGEIYLRLIYESAPYYYVGVIGRNKKTTAFLLDAVTGKVLATKQN